MISIPVDHPDVIEFVDCKTDLTKVTKANISVRITDKFMVAVKNHEKYTLNFIRDETGEVIKKEIDAYEFFKHLCENNWGYAEPGLLFWDRICNWNLLSCDDSFEYAGVNPCAEEPLPAGGSCLLGSINLSAFVTNDKTFDFDDFKYTVECAVSALNDVLDEGVLLHPLSIQTKTVNDWRQIGLGIMGLGDMLIKTDIRYGSKEAVELCDMIGYAMADTAIKTSALLAKHHGRPYPKYHKHSVMQSAWLTKNAIGEDTKKLVEEYGLYNSQLLTCAPTGSLSSMLGITGGIEPIFANYYERKTESLVGHDKYYKVYTPIVKEYMEKHNLKDDKELPDFFVTAHEIDYKGRIAMQAVWQQHIDASISSTINLKNTATVEDVVDLYITAWEKGLKGVTVYRDGCYRAGILSIDTKQKSNSKEKLARGYILKADDNCIGKKRTLRTGCGTLHCEAFFDTCSGELLETYFSKGSSGGCNNFMVGLSRMISLAARGGIDVYSIVDQLKSSGTCPSYAVRSATKHDTSKGSCCPVAIGNALLDMYTEIQKELTEDDNDDNENNNNNKIIKSTRKENKCPNCGGNSLVQSGGCISCADCGWSKCD